MARKKANCGHDANGRRRRADGPTPEDLGRLLEAIRAGIPLNPEKSERLLEKWRRGLINQLKQVEALIAICELGTATGRSKRIKAKYEKLAHCLDSWLTEILDLVSCKAAERAMVSDDAGLIGVASIRCGLSNLPRLLERMPDSEWDNPEYSDCAGFRLLDDLAPLIRFVEKDALQHPERYRLWTREQPFFPMMIFRNMSAYRKRFEELADAVRLGARCPINTARDAQFRWDVPINVLVFETLLEFLRVFGFLRWGNKTPAAEATTPEKILKEEAYVDAYAPMATRIKDSGLKDKLVRIFLAAYALPPLTKDTAGLWAKHAVIPYLQAVYPDWRTLPELAPYILKAGGLSKAKEAITESLRALAKPASPIRK